METPDLLVALTTTLIAAAIGGAVAVRLAQSAVVGYIAGRARHRPADARASSPTSRSSTRSPTSA